MPLVRFLVALACALVFAAGWVLQNGHRNAALDLCPWIMQFSSYCPAWLADRTLSEMVPWTLYGLSGFGLVFLIGQVLRGSLDQPPETALAEFIQRGRDLHERCRKEGDQAVLSDIKAWIAEVTQYLRHLGHRYVVAFGEFRDVQLFASQYDTAATLEIRQRIQRLMEFAQRFSNGEAESG
jgi:hypothetical protein